MEAELISYTSATDTVVLQIDGQRVRTTTKASAFSQKDQEFFKEFLRESEKFKSLEVSSKDKSEKFETKRGLYLYEKRKEHFEVTVENRGSFAINDLTAKYDIYFTKYDKTGERAVEVKSGEECFEAIGSSGEFQFTTDPVEINISCATTSSCPKCVKKASTVERERVLGMRVRVYNGDDELLTEYYSSNSVRSVASKLDPEA